MSFQLVEASPTELLHVPRASGRGSKASLRNPRRDRPLPVCSDLARRKDQNPLPHPHDKGVWEVVLTHVLSLSLLLNHTIFYMSFRSVTIDS